MNEPTAGRQQIDFELLNSVRSRDLGRIAELLRAGADPNCTDQAQLSALTTAAGLGFDEVVVLLLASGAKPVWPEQCDWTALHSAAHAGNVNMCRSLVDHGASASYRPDKCDYFPYRTPFQRAVESGRVGVVRYFVEHCGEDVLQRSVEGKTMEQLAKVDDVRTFLNSFATEAAVRDAVGFEGDCLAGTVQKRSFPSL